MDDLTFEWDAFSGHVRLFPLPNLVMFPNVMQPLHIFEPRYIELVEDALAGDRLMATCLLLPGWEKNYEGRPAVAPVACLGKIASYQRQDDGTYNILLLGQRRVRLLEELPPLRHYREALVEVLRVEGADTCDPAAVLLSEELQCSFQKLLPELPVEGEALGELLCHNLPLGLLADIVTYTLDLEICTKQSLLEECNAIVRAKRLLRYVAQFCERSATKPALRNYPPKFSAN